MQTEAERKKAEMDFHDQREHDRAVMSEDEWRKKYANKRWYVAAGDSDRFVDDWLRDNAAGKVALDFGCGLGGTSLRLAKAGAFVHAIDISPESVEATRKLLETSGFGDRIKAEPMDAENTKFADSTFDIIMCMGVLHHMDVTKAFPELARILKPGGVVLGHEALGYNPAINLYRRMTPKLRTEWETDHILTLRELNAAKASFGSQNVNFFHLLSIGSVPFYGTFLFKPLFLISNALDKILLRIPGIRLMAWQMVFLLSKPNKQ